MAVQVHHGHDQHFAIFHRVNDAVGKPMRAAAADFGVQRLPGVRPLDDAGDGEADFRQKIVTESGNL